MNREQISFQVAFCRRNRALFEFLNDDQIEVIIKDAWNHFMLSSDSNTISHWFEFKYMGWAGKFCTELKYQFLTEDVKSALINSAQS